MYTIDRTDLKLKKACIMKAETWCIRLLIFVTNIRLNSPTLSCLYVISKGSWGYTPDPVTKGESGREWKTRRAGHGMKKRWDPNPQLELCCCAPGSSSNSSDDAKNFLH
jgi:hypothetical protein